MHNYLNILDPFKYRNFTLGQNQQRLVILKYEHFNRINTNNENFNFWLKQFKSNYVLS